MLAAVTSILGFIFRGILMIMDSPILEKKLVKIAPHIVDTILLGSAITLAVMISQYPMVDSWLTAKLIALVAYIGLGVFALKIGKTKSQRVIAWLLAIATFGFIISVAISKNPMGFLA